MILQGKTLGLISPTSSHGDQINAVNGVINELNGNRFKIVKSGITSVKSDGNPINWTEIKHNLGRAPIAIGYFNNATIGSISTNASVPLPAWAGVSIGAGTVDFTIWLQVFADDVNVYVLMLNGTGAPVEGLSVRYLLLEETAAG